MPIFEYRCQRCRKKNTVLFRTLSAVNHNSVICEYCGGKRLDRMMSKVRVMRGSADASLGPQGDVDESLLNEMGGLDENDPRALGRFMRKMADETGEELGPEFSEVVGRLEKGEDPDKIEQSMGDVFGDAAGPAGMGGMDSMDDGPSSPAAPEPAPKPKPRARKKRPAKS